ncbi:MAG: SDR family oxidoreductase [Novosphingobium sp.]|nr:SDR family oxidoreductase [Novosphingobium sp.]
MRILVLGAGGFIGRHVVARLLADGHAVTGVARSTGALEQAFPDARWLAMDLGKAVRGEDWADRLQGIDAVVNCAGVLRGADMDPVHVAMPRALHAAAKVAGVKRVVLLSAISARPDVRTDYAQSKLAGEAALRESGLEWTILRPSLVYAEGSYGGTSLLRGLAALPWAVPVPAGQGHGFSPLHAADLAEAAARACTDPAMAGQVLEPCGPRDYELRDLLGLYREWLGFGPARFLAVPLPLMRLLGRVGDLTGSGPVSTNSLEQLLAGNAGDGAAFAKSAGFAPRSLESALRDHPAQVQDRWHARLFFLAPAVRWVLALLWFASALAGFLHGAEWTRQFGQAAGLPQPLAELARIATSALDIGVGLLVLLDRRGRWATMVQLAMVLGYTVVLSWALPQLWADPLGAMLKNLPVLVLILVHGAIADSR